MKIKSCLKNFSLKDFLLFALLFIVLAVVFFRSIPKTIVLEPLKDDQEKAAEIPVGNYVTAEDEVVLVTNNNNVYFLVDDAEQKFEFWNGKKKVAEIDNEGNLWLRGKVFAIKD
jgi:hypothetical protein